MGGGERKEGGRERGTREREGREGEGGGKARQAGVV